MPAAGRLVLVKHKGYSAGDVKVTGVERAKQPKAASADAKVVMSRIRKIEGSPAAIRDVWLWAAARDTARSVACVRPLSLVE